MAMFAAARNDMQSVLNNLQTSMAEESKEKKSTVMHDVLQPGRPDEVFQCFIKRERTSTTSTYTLSLSLGPPDNSAIGATGTEGKFLLVARKVRGVTGTEHIICSDANNFMRKGANVVGKLRSNILGTNFKIYESQLLHHNGAVSSNHGRSQSSTEVSPGVQAGTLKVAEVDYNQLSNGVRRMRCTLHTIPATTIDAKGLVQPVPMAFPATRINKKKSFCSCGLLHCLKSKSTAVSDCSVTDLESKRSRLLSKDEPLVLKNMPPRWHDLLGVWVLNFRGRVTMESVKNFQLAIVTKPNPTYSQTGHDGVIEPNETSSKASHHDKVLLQFGKIGKDMFTMDYRYPFSAFQAFAICLSSFDWKFFNPINFDKMRWEEVSALS